MMKILAARAASSGMRQRRTLAALVLSAVLASAAEAAPQDVDLAGPCPNPDYTIFAVLNQPLNLDLGVLNASAASVTMILDEAPNGAGCGAGPISYPCANGVTVTLPDTPGNQVPVASAQVNVSGPATGTDGFYFVVEVDDGVTSCLRRYDVVVVQPYDLVFVLDRSGSMNRMTSAGVSRWQALEDGVNALMPFIQASSCADASRFGLSLFATTDLMNASFSDSLVNVDGALGGGVAAELIAQSPANSTAMGLGLQNGIGKMDMPSRPRVVMLFTDGEQNQAPEVELAGTTYSGGASIAPAGPGPFTIVTVGIDHPSGDYQTTLSNLAATHGGTYHATDMGTDITATLVDAIDDILAGCSPQKVVSYSGTFTQTETLPAFDLNRKLGKLLILITYDRRFDAPSLQQLLAGVRIRKDGTDITSSFTPVVSGTSSNSGMLRLDFGSSTGSISSPGNYVIEMTNPFQRPIGYRVVPFADDHRLEIDKEVIPASPRVGQSFRLAVSLSWLGQPVTNAAVEAVIMRPGDDLGDRLARTSRRIDFSQGPDFATLGYQKYLDLLNDPDFVAAMAAQEQILPLAHQGGGDYGAEYKPGDVSGVYRILYRISAVDPEFGTIQRLASESVYVGFGVIDLAASAVNTQTGRRTVRIDIRPTRPDGRLIGPGQQNAFAVTGAGINLTSVTDHLDGRYTLLLRGNPESEVTVVLLGERIYQGPASGFGTP